MTVHIGGAKLEVSTPGHGGQVVGGQPSTGQSDMARLHPTQVRWVTSGESLHPTQVRWVTSGESLHPSHVRTYVRT